VSVWCGDERFRTEFAPRLTTWANRNGAVVKWEPAPTADVLLIPPTDLGARVAAGEATPVPASLTGDAAGFQWAGLLRVYHSSLVRWGTREYAVPLVGEGYVLVYRADRLADPARKKAFVDRFRREPTPIRTWEDLADVAAGFAPDGQPGLPPLPPTTPELLTQFGQIAACFDRLPMTNTRRQKGDDTDYLRLGLSFLVNGETGEPRVTAPSVAEAFRWYHATAGSRPKAAGDAVDALVSGPAVAAVLPLSDLHRLPKGAGGAVDPKFGVTAVPGTRKYFDPKGNPLPATSNFVPHFGGGGLVGVVRPSASNPEACWNLLAELGGPAGSTTTVDGIKLGGGPLRSAHLSDDSRQWRQYRFDEARTADLGRAMQHYASTGVLNPALALRTPDQAAIAELIVKQVRRAAAGEVTAEEAVRQASDDWAELDKKTPEAERRAWRRKSAGLE
jgi:ABC-type glycerol-3-phosphate transport system substrate-binding protein